MARLRPCLKVDYSANLRLNFSKQGENDEFHVARQLRGIKIVQVITLYKPKLKILSTFCKCTQPKVASSIPRNYLILCMLFHRSFRGLSPFFLVR